jgi:hypothetical protein
MTRDPALPFHDDKDTAQLDAAVALLIRLIAGQAVRELAAVAHAKETNSDGAENQD